MTPADLLFAGLAALAVFFAVALFALGAWALVRVIGGAAAEDRQEEDRGGPR